MRSLMQNILGGNEPRLRRGLLTVECQRGVPDWGDCSLLEHCWTMLCHHGTAFILVTQDEALAARCRQQLKLVSGKLS